jgi:hypothetical protein
MAVETLGRNVGKASSLPLRDLPQLQTVGAAAQIARKQPLASESEAPLGHVVCLDFVGPETQPNNPATTRCSRWSISRQRLNPNG